MLENNIQTALSQKLIDLDDAIDIREVRNVKLANQLLKIKRRKKQERDQKMQQENQKAQADANAQAQQVAAQAEIQKNQAITQNQMQLEQGKSQLELQKMQQAAMAMQQNPQMQMTPEMQQAQVQMQVTQRKIDARKAALIAEMMEDYMKEETKITSRFGNDPIAMLRARELDIRAQDNEAKRRDAEERLNLENMKAMMNQRTQDEKLEQNEKLAELRADTSIEKTEMTNEARERLAMMKPRGNRNDR